MDVDRFARPEVRPKNRFLKVLLEDSVINCLETNGVCLFFVSLRWAGVNVSVNDI